MTECSQHLLDNVLAGPRLLQSRQPRCRMLRSLRRRDCSAAARRRSPGRRWCVGVLPRRRAHLAALSQRNSAAQARGRPARCAAAARTRQHVTPMPCVRLSGSRAGGRRVRVAPGCATANQSAGAGRVHARGRRGARWQLRWAARLACAGCVVARAASGHCLKCDDAAAGCAVRASGATVKLRAAADAARRELLRTASLWRRAALGEQPRRCVGGGPARRHACLAAGGARGPRTARPRRECRHARQG